MVLEKILYMEDQQLIIAELENEIITLKEEIVNVVAFLVKHNKKKLEKEKYKYEAMCSDQAESDCAKYIRELQDDNEYLHMKCEIQEVDLIKHHNFIEKLTLLMNSKVDKVLGINLDKSAEIKPKEIQELIDESFK
tara:strand:+ start:86 stop:493 length:408 start_codon:yes stop_codon:yes gene_type:complete